MKILCLSVSTLKADLDPIMYLGIVDLGEPKRGRSELKLNTGTTPSKKRTESE